MIEVMNFRQGSEAWENFRKGKLTASSFDKVFSGRSLKMARLLAPASDNDLATMIKRAKKQFEVYELLSEGEKESKDLNASGLKGLVEKGLVELRDDDEGCSIPEAAARKHIDYLIAQTMFTSAELGEVIPTGAMDRGTDMEPIARIEFENAFDLEVEKVGFCYDPELSNMIGFSPDGFLKGRTSGLEIKCPLPHTHLGYLRKGKLPTAYRAQVHGAMAISGAREWYFMSYCPKLPTLTLRIERNGYTDALRECLKGFSAMYQEQLSDLQQLTSEPTN